MLFNTPLPRMVSCFSPLNAALFAVQIGAAFNKDLKEQYQEYRKDMAEKVLADNAELQGAIHI